MKSDYIDERAFEWLLEMMKEENAAVLRVSLETGLRIGDVVGMTLDNLHCDGSIELTVKKTGKPFRGNISAGLAAFILRKARRGWCFPSPKGAGHRSRQTVWRDVKRAADKLHLRQNVTPHTARKIFAVATFRKSDLETTKNALQHDNTATTMLYAMADILTKNAEKAPKNEEKTVNLGAFWGVFVQYLGGMEKINTALQAALTNFLRDA